ncbi:hypothetical protein EDB87DRAFT_1716250 [Lactarius vividus]|nr:hypothetical protein EDB87DRAFT_1716250 [Lactarius vividus]
MVGQYGLTVSGVPEESGAAAAGIPRAENNLKICRRKQAGRARRSFQLLACVLCHCPAYARDLRKHGGHPIPTPSGREKTLGREARMVMMYLSQARNQSSMPDQCRRGWLGVGIVGYSLSVLDAGVFLGVSPVGLAEVGLCSPSSSHITVKVPSVPVRCSGMIAARISGFISSNFWSIVAGTSEGCQSYIASQLLRDSGYLLLDPELLDYVQRASSRTVER